jgi:hypothetical protein
MYRDLEREYAINAILDLISTTTMSIRAACQHLGNSPDTATIFRWLDADAAFRERYARAREAQAHVLADEMIEIADTPQVGQIVTTKADGSVETRSGDMLEHRRLRIEARKWLMGKLRPKVYGDKQLHTGSDGEGPVEFVVTRAGAGGSTRKSE